MAQVFNGNGIEQLKVSNGNGVSGMESISEQKSKVWGITMNTPESKNLVTQKPKTNQDIPALEDKWIGWDGPVWCSRYGRFENQEDASADDGYNIKGQPPHQDLGLERCEKHGCNCRVPFQHRSYVQDIQRRVEPMVASLVRLEHQVGTLVHHMIRKEGGASAHDTNGNGNKHVEGGFAEGYDNTTHIDHAPSNTLHTDHTQHSTGPIKENFQKLEARVESLMHQIHQLMNREGHHITEEEPDFYQGGR